MVCSEQLIRCVRDWSSTSLSSQVGIGSNEQDLYGNAVMIFKVSCSDMGVNDVVTLEGRKTDGINSVPDILLLIK